MGIFPVTGNPRGNACLCVGVMALRAHPNTLHFLRPGIRRKLNPVAAVMFGLVKRIVGALEDFIRCGTMHRENTHPEREGDHPQRLLAVFNLHQFDGLADALGALQSHLLGGIRQDQDKLFAAVTAGNILCPDMALKTISPASCPKVSLKRLKWSISSMMMPTVVFLRTARGSSRESDSSM